MEKIEWRNRPGGRIQIFIFHLFASTSPSLLSVIVRVVSTSSAWTDQFRTEKKKTKIKPMRKHFDNFYLRKEKKKKNRKFYYLPWCGPTLPLSKDELAVISSSFIEPFSIPSGAMHCAEKDNTKNKREKKGNSKLTSICPCYSSTKYFSYVKCNFKKATLCTSMFWLSFENEDFFFMHIRKYW